MNDAIDEMLERGIHICKLNFGITVSKDNFFQALLPVLIAMKTPEKTDFTKLGHRVPCDDPKDDWEELVSQDEGCPLWDEDEGCRLSKLELPKVLAKEADES